MPIQEESNQFPEPDYYDTEGHINRIDGLWYFRREANNKSSVHSPPGHLLHFITQGEFQMRCQGIEYHLKCNQGFAYFDSEYVEWLHNDKAVEFLSICFTSPSLPPLPEKNRVFTLNKKILHEVKQLKGQLSKPINMVRKLDIYASTNILVREIWSKAAKKNQLKQKKQATSYWWDIENQLRAQKKYHISIEDCCHLASCSRVTLHRMCKKATGLSPQQRIRSWRMAEAKSLLCYTILNVSQIAKQLKYPRVHEFSREFKKELGISPSSFRKQC